MGGVELEKLNGSDTHNPTRQTKQYKKMKQNNIKQVAALLLACGILAFFAGCLMHWLSLWIVAVFLVFLSFVPLAIQESKTARHLTA